MNKSLLLGFVVMGLFACNKGKPADAVATGEHAETGGRGGGWHGGHKRLCEGDKGAEHLAKMQKCQSEAAAACNTQVYGSATPTKEVICASPDKMKDVWKCTREKYAGDKDKMHADRKKMRECMGGGAEEPAEGDAAE